MASAISSPQSNSGFKEGRQFSLAGNSEAALQALADEIGFARNRSCFSGRTVECCWKSAAGK